MKYLLTEEFTARLIKNLTVSRIDSEELRQKIVLEFAIDCAENVLHYYIEEHPRNDSPKHAIKAAKTVLNYNTEDGREFAAHAAAYASKAGKDSAEYFDYEDAHVAPAHAAFAAEFAAKTAYYYNQNIHDGTYANSYSNAVLAANYACMAVDFSTDCADKYKEQARQENKIIEIINKYKVSSH